MSRFPHNGIVFVVLLLACIGAVSAYLYRAKVGLSPSIPLNSPAASKAHAVVSVPTPVEPQLVPEPPNPGPAKPSRPFQLSGRIHSSPTQAPARRPRQIFFRYTGVDNNYGKLASVTPEDRNHPVFVDGLLCEVVHFAAGKGVCLTADRGVFTTYAAEVFDSNFHRLFTIPQQGIPSRCRVSRDGKLAAVTVFVNGHSYTSLNFSTQTLLIEVATAKVLADLESFSVTRNGNVFRSQDFNLWGVTFTPDSKHFYCTLSSNNIHYLIEANITARSATVVHENVECPSLSPDASHIAFKKRFTVGGRVLWQLYVLNLATGMEVALSEKRSIDDQLEWLDDGHVLYASSDNPTGSSATTNVWKAAVDGKTEPELFLPKAYSPAVVY